MRMLIKRHITFQRLLGTYLLRLICTRNALIQRQKNATEAQTDVFDS